MLKNVKSIKMLFVFGTAGNIILWCNNTIYWMLLNKICFVDSDNTIFYICKKCIWIFEGSKTVLYMFKL